MWEFMFFSSCNSPVNLWLFKMLSFNVLCWKWEIWASWFSLLHWASSHLYFWSTSSVPEISISSLRSQARHGWRWCIAWSCTMSCHRCREAFFSSSFFNSIVWKFPRISSISLSYADFVCALLPLWVTQSQASWCFMDIYHLVVYCVRASAVAVDEIRPTWSETLMLFSFSLGHFSLSPSGSFCWVSLNCWKSFFMRSTYSSASLLFKNRGDGGEIHWYVFLFEIKVCEIKPKSLNQIQTFQHAINFLSDLHIFVTHFTWNFFSATVE